jgi:hypothetical protein
MLARLFPEAQFIFTYRNPITTIHSAERYVAIHDELPPVGDLPGTDAFFDATCRHWVEAMRSWRRVRTLIEGRHIEIAQEEIAADPTGIADRLTRFLHVPDLAARVSDAFKTVRENTAFPDREVTDYRYRLEWGEPRRNLMTSLCGDEAARWGYTLRFDSPAGPSRPPEHELGFGFTDFEAYCHWAEVEGNERARALDLELQHCLDLIDRIAKGRAMRILNRLDPLFLRLGLR